MKGVKYMKIAFFSNYMNHHQKMLCDELYRLTRGDFRFVACEQIKEERLALGYEDMNNIDYVLREYEDKKAHEEAEKWCMESDIIIHGSAPEEFVTKRLKKNLPVFRYSERIFKKGSIYRFSPKALKALYDRHGKFKRKPLFMLCASAYTAMDMHCVFAYPDKAFRWGYFPEVKRYENIDELISRKEPNSILWVGRFLDLKHPEMAIKIAKCLKSDGYNFKLNMIGNGTVLEKIKELVMEENLSDVVTLHGAMSPEQVRQHMEKSQIFLFTSDRNEGWGAVLNESMNSACAVVASHIIGSVPYLIDDDINGFIYRDGDVIDLTCKVKRILDNPQKAIDAGKMAYMTLTEQWNPRNAAKRFVNLAEAVCRGEKNLDIYEGGVCSKSPLLKDNWYK